MRSAIKDISILVTDDLQGDGSFVLKAIHFQRHLINPRVLPLSAANEQDAVTVTVPDVHSFCVQRLTILQPGNHRLGLSLMKEKSKRDKNE